jgi:hypothetical protein
MSEHSYSLAKPFVVPLNISRAQAKAALTSLRMVVASSWDGLGVTFAPFAAQFCVPAGRKGLRRQLVLASSCVTAPAQCSMGQPSSFSGYAVLQALGLDVCAQGWGLRTARFDRPLIQTLSWQSQVRKLRHQHSSHDS